MGSSAAAGFYLGAGAGKFYGFAPKVTGALMFLIAMFGSERLAIAALRQLAADPVGVVRRVFNTIMGGSDA